MKYSKKQLQEIIDSSNIIIGSETAPEYDANGDTAANGTTDKNVKTGQQNFKYDFLGRFGFYFYESKDDASKLQNDLINLFHEKYVEILKYYHVHADELESDYVKYVQKEGGEPDEMDKEFADKVMKLFEPHMKKKLDESKVVEDKIVDRKKTEMKKEKTDNDVLSKEKKLEKISGLLSNLPQNDLDKLMNLLEAKRKK